MLEAEKREMYMKKSDISGAQLTYLVPGCIP